MSTKPAEPELMTARASHVVVVYQSEAERAFDQWIWHQGGWLVFLLAICLGALVKWFTRRRG